MLEDLVGEYVLNISKEKLKVSTIKGKIKLDNVELDGDFIGSHILSGLGLGLSGFGVLSCWARRLQINIPWKNLDNEPTSLEIRGMHLICVPLLPTTANRVYYGGMDSALSLRTRAKRAALARLERNFFSGRIPGENQHHRHVQQQGGSGENNDVLSYSGRRRQYSSSEDVDEGDLFVGDSIKSVNTSEKMKKEGRIPALKRKLKAKIYGNLVSSVSDVHIRFEVPNGGLERTKDNTVSSTKSDISDERAFAFGLTLKSLTARNVSGDESSGGSESQASDDSDTKRKKIDILDLSIYWDDGPSYLISESEIFSGQSNLSASVCQERIAEIMQQMSCRTDPGVNAKRSPSRTNTRFGPVTTDEHDFICTNFSQTLHTTFCKGNNEDSLYFVEILSSKMEVNLTSQQYRQYQRLKDAVFAQQRFDTMLHQRPSKSPTHAPRLWWHYAIACVRHKPTSRSWTDVEQIVQCRRIYIDLVTKNLLCESERSGFHGGLTTKESQELLDVENFLPIETLISFHLLALRRVVARRFESVSASKSIQSKSGFARRSSSSSLGRRLFRSLTGSTNSFYGDDAALSSLLRRHSSVMNKDRLRVPSLLEDDDISLAPSTHTTCMLQLCSLKMSILDARQKKIAVTMELDFRGTSYDSGSGKSEIIFDITKFDIFDFVTSIEVGNKVLTVEVDETSPPQSACRMNGAQVYDQIYSPSESRIDAVQGSACQVVAKADGLDFSLDVIAHPATVLWSQECTSFILDWSASVMSVSRFISQLKDATTPGAHRAQIALLYPTSFSLSLDINAPKLWIPVSRKLKAGALLLDAGQITVNVSKPKQSMQTTIDVDAGNINIMLAQEIYGLAKRLDEHDLTSLIYAKKKYVNIVQPFQIRINGESGLAGDIEDNLEDHFPDVIGGVSAGKVSLIVGAIQLNLIDVERLAKALGHFFASGVSRMRQISESGVLAKASLYSSQQNNSAVASSQSHATNLRIFVESVEMLLESYPSKESSSLDRGNRSYLVDIRCINIHRRSMAMKSFSRFSVSDVTVQLAEAERGTRKLKSGAEQIFASMPTTTEHFDRVGINGSREAPRTPNRRMKTSAHRSTPLRTPKSLSLSFFPASPNSESANLAFSSTDLIHGCHFHDGEKHGDEIELDVMPAILKVTPTSIQDCAGAVKRLFECGILISKEMERRVHEGGRLARATSQRHPVENICTDSSLLFRVTLNDAAILLGRPASEFNFHRNSKRYDYVIQILTKASFIGQSIENDDGSGSRTQHLSVSDFAASINKSFDFMKMSGKSPMLVAPTSADVRVVRKTEKEGRAISQDFSFDVESLRVSVVPHDIQVITSVTRKVLEKLEFVSKRENGDTFSPFLLSKSKGSSIPTCVRAELHIFSFLIIRSFKPRHHVRPFLDVSASAIKVNVEGCAAFVADLGLQLGIKFYNPVALEWEDLMDTNSFIAAIEFMPSEVTVSFSSCDVIRTNCSSIMIQDLANIERVKNMSLDDIEQGNGVNFFCTNETGLEVILSSNEGKELPYERQQDDVAILPGETCPLDFHFNMYNLKITSDVIDSSCCSLSLEKLTSKSGLALFRMGSYEYIDLEPVVEIVFENQRLAPMISDVYSMEKGQDLLDSNVWSPSVVSGNERKWLPPYHLEGDIPEFSDSTSNIVRTKHEVELPDSNWSWINDWQVDIGTTSDSDGWEYAPDFGAFNRFPRRYRSGDLCRRRRWTRTRIARKSKTVTLTKIYMVLETISEAGRTTLKARSRVRVVNETSMPLSVWGLTHLQGERIFLGSVASSEKLCVPLLQSTVPFISMSSFTSHVDKDEMSQPIMIITPGFTSHRIIRTSFRSKLSSESHHFLVHLKSDEGILDIIIQPVLILMNLLPCTMQARLGEIRRGNIEETEEITIGTGTESHCFVNPQRRPQISVKVPGYNWSRWSMIINREPGTLTWLPINTEEDTLYENPCDDCNDNEVKRVFHLRHICNDGAQLQLIMSVESGHVPVVRCYAQYWIIDKTALGLNFFSGTKAGTYQEKETIRKTYLPRNVQKYIPKSEIEEDGHEWSLGMNGMTLFFSTERVASFAVGNDLISDWSSCIDVDKPMPESVKTAISVENYIEGKRFELAYNVTRCPSLFSRTSIISFYSRYQVVNLLGTDIYVAQEGALDFSTHISTQSCVQISGLDSQLPSKIRVSVGLDLWTLGGIELDKIGITSIRIPTAIEETLVVQCEVRLATKKQDSAVVIVLWTSNVEQNPLYLLKNTSLKTVFCSQLLSSNSDHGTSQQDQSLSFVDNFLQCGTGLESLHHDDDVQDDFVWTLLPGESKVFGLCNPEKVHVIHWSVNQSDLLLQRANSVELGTIGSRSSCVTSNGMELNCTIEADRSTKVILFSSDDEIVTYDDFTAGIVDFVAMSLKIEIPGISISMIDNNSAHIESAREIFLVSVEGLKMTVAQSREGFHELEAKLKTIQVDNFIFDATHRVLVSVMFSKFFSYCTSLH